ncbi:MAG: 1-acyl-sn-glycerol-3-phosphate acyltransferase [Muribaculaceae bacterium]|nr:1-acyl-sn-glycerol-3-phosphate acyltransferase [Muribaculaceae bacterium]
MKQQVARYVFEKLLRWHITTTFPDVDKSIIVVAPHTSICDAILGKLVLLSYGLKHKILSKESLFVFPFGYIMQWFGSIPVRKNDSQTCRQLIKLLKENDRMHLVICPEGTRHATNRWNMGFCAIAKLTGTPVFAVYIDYQERGIGVKGQVSVKDKQTATADLINYYQHTKAKNPSDFILPVLPKKEKNENI